MRQSLFRVKDHTLENNLPFLPPAPTPPHLTPPAPTHLPLTPPAPTNSSLPPLQALAAMVASQPSRASSSTQWAPSSRSSWLS